MVTDIPDIVIGRLPIYLRTLYRMAEEGSKTNTSSHDLGERLGISSAQIRKDLSHFGEFGKQGTGYNIGYLISQLEQILKLQEEWPVVLIGAGYLGHALAHYHRFQLHGFHIGWIFDDDPAKLGRVMNGLPVQHTDELEAVIQREGVRIAILAVPAGAAQQITDRLVAAGIRSILNYAPISVSVPADVHVQYSDPVVQLQRMTYYL
ncbi:MAG: redox-sensing transcriptional repressor Rex [Ardenticatenaceae bacterium]|nr:redox-sensing transcriptional repressor Rex [Anaerolineales bacterium]MCB8919112.1 redox-sensing transcriptional repressor Rex [Ardenticatenaceae bacterium]